MSNDGIQNQFFDNWAYQLSRKLKYNSVKTYCYAIKVFLNYVLQMAQLEGGLTPSLLSYALEKYESYLVFGTQSGSETVRAVAQVLGNRNLKGSSVVSNLAAVNRFITSSEQLRLGMLELETHGMIVTSALSGFSLQTCVSVDAPATVRAALKRNSWLAGCIAGGAKRIKRAGLAPDSKPSDIAYTDEFGGDELCFPIDLCQKLIQKASSLRDKLLWCLLAATGCRISEALTMLSSDVLLSTSDLESNKVFVVDPATRHHILLKYLSEDQIHQLPHKGRKHSETFMLEPFSSMFWVTLEQYKTEEREKDKQRPFPKRHGFLFRNITTGEPIVFSYQTVFERFQKAALEVTGKVYGFHSLRHMYGYYLVNHCVNPNPRSNRRYGLDLHLVQKYMGHASPDSTKRYARQDAQMLSATISAVNFSRMTGGPKTVRDARIAFLKNEIALLENQSATEVA
ncbi:site-specific integrase [Pseudomonas kurunegalensis]|uniref:site-specific integrase n=1 Tax=Pseudomonas kurunegalensis TaxID=485880 RepID=UPI002363EB36|nr:site-specific integrase [Pseudomonas kurunegalensis]MDD2133471.1 site-specific integrase [Pseudomonas kurunegalensis]